jgi:hypothetical protein
MVDVFYNPANPLDTCLSPLVVAQDVSILFYFTQVIGMFLFVWLKAGRELNWPGKMKPVAGGVKILSERMTTRVRLPRFQPVWLGMVAMGILSVVAGIVIQASHTVAPVPAGLWAVAIILVSGAAVYLWQYQRLATGIQDLVIDEGARTIELPLTYKRRERRPLAFNNVTGVTLEKIAHRGRSGVSYTYAPTLQLRDGVPQRLTDLSLAKAESFAAWLRDKLGVPASEIPPDDAE